MANERIVSPGVFTFEKDLSFLPQGIGAIGAALIGPTLKGPAFVPTVVNGYSDFLRIFGGAYEQSYLPYTAKSYLTSAGSATIVRVLGSGGYKLNSPIGIIASGSFGRRLISMLHPTFVVPTEDSTDLFEQSTIENFSPISNFVLTLSGSFQTETSAFTNMATDQNGTFFSASIDPESDDFVGDLFGHSAYGTNAVYNYVCFGENAAALMDDIGEVEIEFGSTDDWDFEKGYSDASTPWITSQKIGGNAQDLFKFSTISHGIHANYEIKVGIANIRPAGSIAGSEFGEFDVVIRAVDQTKLPQTPFTAEDDDIRPNIIESFRCNLDPNSPKFISRVIGDRYITSTDEGKLLVNGDYANRSKYIRVEVTDSVLNAGITPSYVPFGFRSLKSPIPVGFSQPPSASFVANQVIAGEYNRRIYYGFNYDFGTTDNFNYLRPLPVTGKTTIGNNVDFYLGNYNQSGLANFPSSTNPYSGSIDLSSSTSADTRKFIVPFQGGFDGHKPNLQKKTGAYNS